MKPLGRKAYGSIPHLPGSRLGIGDHHCHEGQAIIATQKFRDKHDAVIVQEKLDGSNVAVCKIENRIIPLTRAGHKALSSPHEQHHKFDKWVMKNYSAFDHILKEGVIMENKIEVEYGGRNASKEFQMQQDFVSKWHLSTEGYYFKYRADKNNNSIIRATLYRTKENTQVDDVRVSEYAEFGTPHKSHHQVINYFEARLTLGQIK